MPDLAAAGRTRHLDGDAVGDAARRHDRRHRRQSRQVHGRRPPDPDPRAARTRRPRDDLSVVSTLPVPTPSGVTVPLSSVAEIRFGQGPSSIAPLQPRAPRRHRRRHGAGRRAQRGPGHGLGSCRRSRTCRPARASRRPATPRSWARCSPASPPPWRTGLMLVLVVLILLFGSVFHSVTILGSLPLAIGGVVAGALAHQHRRSRCRWSSAS